MSLFFATYLMLHYIDYRQTTAIHDSPTHYEVNPFIGRNANRASVNRWFVGTTAAAYYIDQHMRHGETRKVLQCMFIGFSATAVARNYSIGIRINF